MSSGVDGDHATANLVEFDRLIERLEVAVAEAFIALALDDLEKDRAEGVLREDLEQDALVANIAVDQDAVLLEPLEILAMAGDALVDQLVIGLDRVLQLHAARAQLLHSLVDIGGGEREMLDAFAVVIADEFLDLALVVLALVERNADRLVGRDHRLAEQAGGLALDVEILLLLEAEELGVEGRPHAHLAALHIVGEVIEQVEADIVLGGCLLPAGDF